MATSDVEQVRSFNRIVTRRVGALEDDYLARGRPLGEARLLYEIGAGGADLRGLRDRLALDSGYLSRLAQSLKAQGLIDLRPDPQDGRQRRAVLTRRGEAEVRAYDQLSDRLAASILDPLDSGQRARLVAAMSEVERLLRVAGVAIAFEPSDSADAQACLDAYFRELAARFEVGFDPAASPSPPTEYAPPRGAFVMARFEGKPVGIGALKALDAGTGEIKRVWTAPGARGLGVARRILHALEGAARERGFALLRLDTNRTLSEAQAFYVREGYREIGRYNDNPYADHWFEKRLESL